MKMIALFIAFLKVGLFSFGGGNAMLPLIYQSVKTLGVMDASGFSDMVALSQVTPGPVAVNAATYIGLKTLGMPGAVIATIGVCLPCFIIMIIVIKVLDRFKGNKYIEGIFVGIRPVTIGLILSAVVFIAGGVLVKGSLISIEMADIEYYNFFAIAVFIASILMMTICKVKPIYVVLIMAGVGMIACVI